MLTICWADRLALAWGAVISFVFFFGSLPHDVMTGFWPNVGTLWLYFVAPPWGLLRTLDLIFGGPWRRAHGR